MKKHSDETGNNDSDYTDWERERERERITGLGQRSLHKTNFPAFQQNLRSLNILQQAVEQSASGILIGDRRGRVEFVNQAWSTLTGLPRESLIGENLADHWPADSEPLLEILEGLNDGNAWQGELCFQDEKGTRWMQTSVTRVLDDASDQSHFIAVIDDITLRKDTEQELNRQVAERTRALAESEARLQDITDSTSDWIWEVDAEGVYTFCSGAIQEVLGYRPEELLGRTPFDLMPPEEAEQVGKVFAGMLSRKKPIVGLENWNLTKEGRRVCLLTNAVPIFDQAGRLTGYRGADQDITARKEMEEELARSEYQFRSLAEASPDNIIRYDKQMRIRYINGNLLRFFGFDSAERLLGRHPDEIKSRDRFPMIEEAVRRVLADGREETLELTIPLPSGDILYHHLLLVPERDAYGDIIGTIIFGRDLTDFKRTEVALERSNARFQTLFESSPDPVWIIDQNRFIDCNQAAVEILGYPDKARLLDTHPSQLSPPVQAEGEDSYSKAERMMRIVNEQGLHRFEWIHRRADGSDFTAEVTLSRIELDDHPVIYCMWRDISERKQAQEALARSETMLRAVIEAAPVAITDLDLDGRIHSIWNKTAEKMFGWSADEVIGEILPTVPRGKREELYALVEKIRQGLTLDGVDLIRQRRDGSPIEYSLYASPLRDPDGNISGNIAVMVDITERKALQTRLELLENTLNNSGDEVHIINSETLCFEYANEVICHNLGYSSEELSGMTPADIDPDFSIPRLRGLMEELKGGGSKIFETRHRHRDGTTYPVEINIVMVNHLGQDYALAIARDISERKRMESALEDTKNRLAAVVDTIPDLVWMKDPDGVFLACNPEIERLFEAPESEIIGKTDYDFMPRELADNFREKDREVMAAGRISINEEEVLYRADDYRATLETRKVPVLGADGEVLGVLGIGRDITERKQAEEALRRSEARFRMLYESTPAMMHSIDTDGKIVYVSNTWLEKLGYARDQVIGHKSTEFLTEESRRFAAETVLPAFFETGHSEDIPYQFITGDGRILDILLSAIAEHDGDGKVVRSYAVLQDVTQRNRDVRRIEQLVKQQQAILENELVGIATIRERNFVWVNPALEQMLGYEAGELNGESTRAIFLTDDAYRALGEEGYPIVNAGRVYRTQREFCRKNGDPVWLDVRATLLNEETGENLSTFIDISELRRAELELLAAKDAAEAATRAKSDFLASMSHEIRTPINAILGMLYLVLKSEEMTSTLRERLHKAEGAAKSLLGIINDILDFSKIEAGRLEVEAIEFELDSVIQRLVDTLVIQAEKKGLEYLVRYDINIPTRLVGDPLRLGQILLNLCSNAIKFTEAGEVELALSLQSIDDNELTLRISVRDSGIGMSLEQQRRLFQKFTQADQSNTRRFGGTGLGLTISKDLAELMGGDVWIEHSAPGEGTAMGCRVRLGVVPQSETYGQRLQGQAGPLLEGLRVLVVDDNAVSREILGETLLQFRLEVDCLADGAEAIERLAQSQDSPYDVVLMDWRMPGMNGDEAIRRIHADPRIRPQPKVVMVTAHGRDEVIRSAEEAAVDAVLTKPVTPSMLLDTCLSVLGRGRLLQPARESRSRAAPGAAASYVGAHVLLVEDNEINREFAEELLRSLGIEVSLAVNGLEAVEKAKQTTYDAILMDIQMPELDGLEATRRIRALSAAQNDRFATLPIIAMTALAMAGDREKSLEAGMNDHLTKPIDPERLKAILAHWVEVPEERRIAALPARSKHTGESADLLALKHLDAAQGIRQIGGLPEAYHRQLLRFRDHYRDAAETLQNLIENQGTDAGEAYCHALKGVCGSLCANRLTACVTALDDRLKQGDRPDEAQLDELRLLLTDVIEEIGGLAVPVSPLAKPSPAMSELSVKLAELASLLEDDLGMAEELLYELRSGLSGSELESAVTEIAERMELFEIEDALALIAKLRSQLEAMP